MCKDGDIMMEDDDFKVLGVEEVEYTHSENTTCVLILTALEIALFWQ